MKNKKQAPNEDTTLQQSWPDANELLRHVMEKDVPLQQIDKKKYSIDVSVITVVFNAIKDGRKNMLMEALDSVQSQVGLSIEHLIIDGESTDGTLQLIQDYDNQHHPIRILSQRDNGIYDAMNKGIALAKGEYVIFLNSDDFYHNSKGLLASVNKLRETGCSFSFAPVTILDSPFSYNLHAYPVESIHEVFVHAVFSHQSVLTKRQVMIQMHGFDLSYKSAADYDFILRMILTGHQGCYVNCNFVSYRMTGVSSTNRNRSIHETSLIFMRLYSKFLHAHLTYEEAYQLYNTNQYPSNDPSLKSRFAKIIPKAFVGLPKMTSWRMRLYLPELITILKYLCYGKFTSLTFFLIIHFNSRFNRRWYHLNYEDVKQSLIAPAKHYLEYGWKKGYDPSPHFSTKGYLTKNPDVAQLGICPLVHWKLKGKNEKRSF